MRHPICPSFLPSFLPTIKGARPPALDSLDSFPVSFLVDKISSLTFVRLVSAIKMLFNVLTILTMATIRLKKNTDEELTF
jgi:hypothetical protein